jgi:WD40 repeat protein
MRRALAVVLLITLLIPAMPTQAQDGSSCPGALPSRLVVGERGRATPGDANNVREQPTTQSAIVGHIPGGDFFRVLEGPICAEGMAWWKVESGEAVGWTMEGAAQSYWLEPLPRITPDNASQLKQIATLGDYGYFVGWSPDARTLAMAGAGGVQLIDYDNFQALPRQIDQERYVSHAAFSPDWTLLATARYNGQPVEETDVDLTIRLWDVASGTLLYELEGPADSLDRLLFSLDGTLLLAQSMTGETRIWDTLTGAALTLPDEGRILDFTREGYLYTVDHDGYLWRWDVRRGQWADAAPQLGPVDADRFIFSPAHTQVLAVKDPVYDSEQQRHGVVSLWDIASGTLRYSFEGRFYGADWNSDSIVSNDEDGSFGIRELSTGNVRSVLTLQKDNDYYFVGLDQLLFSRDGNLVVGMGTVEFCAGIIGIWEIATGGPVLFENGCAPHAIFHPLRNELIFTSRGDGVFSLDLASGLKTQLVPGGTIFKRVEFSADGRSLIGYNGALWVWDATSGHELFTLERSGPSFTLSPDGQLLASMNWLPSDDQEADPPILLWQIRTGQEMGAFYYEEGAYILDFMFSPDSTLLGAIGSAVETPIKTWQWDVATGEAQANVQEGLAGALERKMSSALPAGVPDSFHPWSRGVTPQIPAINPDRTLIASQCDDSVCLLDMSTGEIVRLLESVPGYVTGAVFSPDSRLFAAVTNIEGNYYHGQGNLYVWEVATGKLLAAPAGHVGGAWSIAFSPDGTLIATGGGGCLGCEGGDLDDVVRLWAVQ